MFKNTKLSLFFTLFFLICCNNSTYPQLGDIIFKWVDSNTFPVTFNTFEVKAPPDTSLILSKLNLTPIICNSDSCSWSTPVIFDDKVHFFRMNAVKNDTLYSSLSNTASAFLQLPVKAPVILQIIPSFFNK